MTNFEYYKEEILKIVNDKSALGVCKNSNKLLACKDNMCDECIASEEEVICDPIIYAWLYAEHVEKPKLTKKERQFCELVETGWICRDGGKNGILHLANSKLVKDNKNKVWMDEDGFHGGDWTCCITCINEELLKISFPFITWEDEEPWSVEDLLKLEVEE